MRNIGQVTIMEKKKKKRFIHTYNTYIVGSPFYLVKLKLIHCTEGCCPLGESCCNNDKGDEKRYKCRNYSFNNENR